MKYWQHTSETTETFELYTCSMHCILVRASSVVCIRALARRSCSRRQGCTPEGFHARARRFSLRWWHLSTSSGAAGSEVGAVGWACGTGAGAGAGAWSRSNTESNVRSAGAGTRKRSRGGRGARVGNTVANAV
jgi:hypothetical protein